MVILSILIALILLAAIACAVLWGLIWTSFRGGILGTVRELMPPPDLASSKLAKRRSRCRSAMESTFSELENGMQLRCYGTSTHDCCEKGRHNPKVNDPWAYRCTFLETRFYGFNGDFRNQLAQLEHWLIVCSFSVPGSLSFNITELTEYYDDKLGQQKRVWEQGNLQNYLDKLLVSDLCWSEYANNDDLLLRFEFAERETQDLRSLIRTQTLMRGDFVSQKSESLDIGATFEKMTRENQYVMAISIQGKYFENGQLLPKILLNSGRRRRHREQCCLSST